MKSHRLLKATKIFSALTAASVVALTTGCATNNHGQMAASTSLPDTPNTLEIISQESQKALNAQKMLVAYRDQYNNTLDYRQRSFSESKVKVDYVGKPQPLLSSIAIRYGYRFIEYGAERDLATVNFTNYWNTPENIVINLNAQLGEQASISVDKQQKVITLIYPE